MPLRNIGSLLPCHSHVDPATVVGALNHVVDEANSGETVFYDLYTDDEKKQGPARAKTGLFFFRGKPGARFAIIAPGGGFRMSRPFMKDFRTRRRSASADITRSCSGTV
jgi:hypothetical protein